MPNLIRKGLCVLLIAAPCSAQNPFIREGSIGQSKPKQKQEEGLATLEIHEWVGQKFIFLPKSKETQEYGYQSFKPRLPYDKWVGKTVTVLEVRPSTGFAEVSFRTADGKAIKAQAFGHTIHGIAPMRDLEYARSNWLGKTLWIRRNNMATWDESTGKFGTVKFKKYSPLTVEDVVAGWYEHAPVRLILKTKQGETGFDDVSVSGTNIGERLRQMDTFSKNFLEQDPRLDKDWPPEIWSKIEDGKVAIGMTAEQSRMSWGDPQSINRTVTAHGADEQWVYRNNSYLYMKDGKVTAMQN